MLNAKTLNQRLFQNWLKEKEEKEEKEKKKKENKQNSRIARNSRDQKGVFKGAQEKDSKFNSPSRIIFAKKVERYSDSSEKMR